MEQDDLKRALLALLKDDEDLRGLIRGIACSRELAEPKRKTSPSDFPNGAAADRRADCLQHVDGGEPQESQDRYLAEAGRRPASPQSGYNGEMPGPAERRLAEAEAEIRSLRDLLRQKENSLLSLKDEHQLQRQQIEESAKKTRRLQGELQDEKLSLEALEKKNEALEQRNRSLAQDAADKEAECRNFETKLRNAQAENRRLQDSLEDLNGVAAALRKRNEQQSQELAQRFPDGWELFRAYSGVSPSSRELLRGVFVRGDDFVSFICGAAQSASLEKIWKTVKGCISQGNTRDADILWDIFAYAVELVNASKPEKVYEILQAEPGMPFDLEVHALAPGSRNQGNIREIYLLGYKNVYVGRVEQKSIVSL